MPKNVFWAPKGTYFIGFSKLASRPGTDEQNACFLRGKCGLCGSMKIDFRFFEPPLLPNVYVFFALFSALRHLKPFGASHCFVWSHLRPQNTSLFVVSCGEIVVFLCGFDACGPPIGGFGCRKA